MASGCPRERERSSHPAAGVRYHMAVAVDDTISHVWTIEPPDVRWTPWPLMSAEATTRDVHPTALACCYLRQLDFYLLAHSALSETFSSHHVRRYWFLHAGPWRQQDKAMIVPGDQSEAAQGRRRGVYALLLPLLTILPYSALSFRAGPLPESRKSIDCQACALSTCSRMGTSVRYMIYLTMTPRGTSYLAAGGMLGRDSHWSAESWLSGLESHSSLMPLAPYGYRCCFW